MEITKHTCLRCNMCRSRKEYLDTVHDDGVFIYLNFRNGDYFWCLKKWCPYADVYMPWSVDTATLNKLNTSDDYYY